MSSSYFRASPTGCVIRAYTPAAATTQIHLVLSLLLWLLLVCFPQGHLERVGAGAPPESNAAGAKSTVSPSAAKPLVSSSAAKPSSPQLVRTERRRSTNKRRTCLLASQLCAVIWSDDVLDWESERFLLNSPPISWPSPLTADASNEVQKARREENLYHPSYLWFSAISASYTWVPSPSHKFPSHISRGKQMLQCLWGW